MPAQQQALNVSGNAQNLINMETLDWGQVTPEAVKIDSNEFFYIYNHDLTSAEKVDRTIRFILGRLYYYDKHLPKDPIHFIKIDISGQQISDATFRFIEQELKAKYPRPNSLTVNIIKH